MDIYREIILDHYSHPRNFGHLDNPDIVSEEVNISCGDRIGMDILVKKKGKTTFIKDIQFYGEGCAISQASASMLTEKVKGMSVRDVSRVTPGDIEGMLSVTLTHTRLKCALLPLEVLHKGLRSVFK